MTPTFIDHCESVYNALAERATVQHSASINADVLVFTGAVSPIYRALGISQTYYGPIFQTLEDVGSILKVQRGTRGIDTIIALRGLPEVWPEDLGWKGSRSEPLTEDSRYAKILREVQEIQQGSINGIDILTALVELEQRVVALENKVERLGKRTATKG